MTGPTVAPEAEFASGRDVQRRSELIPREPNIPWTRVLIEGAVIVGSILLAFAIDAGWDERQERTEEQEALGSLIQEFERNRDEARDVLEVLEAAQQHFTRLVSTPPDALLRLPDDSVVALGASLAVPRTFDAVRGTVDALIGAGKLGILRDPELRHAISAFLNQVEDSKEDIAYLSDSSMRVWEGLQKYGGPWRIPRAVKREGQPVFLQSVTGETLARARADEELMGLARQANWHAWVYAGEVELILERIEWVLALAHAQLR